eukprot:2093684-Rhodomonas_salina.1
MLWERAREVLVEAGITRTEEIRRDGTWCIPQVPRLTQAMTVGLMHQLQRKEWEDEQVLSQVGRKALVMWPTLTQKERGEVETTPAETASDATHVEKIQTPTAHVEWVETGINPDAWPHHQQEEGLVGNRKPCGNENHRPPRPVQQIAATLGNAEESNEGSGERRRAAPAGVGDDPRRGAPRTLLQSGPSSTPQGRGRHGPVHGN